MNIEAAQKRIQAAQFKGNQKFELTLHTSDKYSTVAEALSEDKAFFIDEVEESDLVFTMVNLTEVKFRKVSAKGNHDMYQFRGRCLKTNASLITWAPMPKGSEPRELGSQMTFPVIHVPVGITAIQGAVYADVTIDGVTKKVATKNNLMKAVSNNAFIAAPRKVAELANEAALNGFLKDIRAEKLAAVEAVGSDI